MFQRGDIVLCVLSGDYGNGLKSASQIMIDKMSTLKKEKIREKIGTLQKELILPLNAAIKLWVDAE